MIHKRKILIIALLIVLCSPAWADDSQIITLKDGSQIQGEVVSLSSGTYSIRSSSLGIIKINAAQVASIANASASSGQIPQISTAGSQDPSLNQKIQSLQSNILNNPEMMNDIIDMAKDPQLTQLLSDPVLVQKIMSRDVKALESDPKAQELMNNPKMRALIDKLRQSNIAK